MEDELRHYGVLGMKWGVRRTPEQFGRRTIKAGTKMYRSTVNAGELTTGTKYVTYLPPDRDMYRGSYANGIRKQSGKTDNDPLYEKQYVLKKDLKVPSRATVQQVAEKIRSNDKGNKVATEMGKAYVKNFLDSDSWSTYRKVTDKLGREPTDLNEYLKEAKKVQIQAGQDYVKNIKDMSVNDYFKDLTDSFGRSSSNREKVIGELKKLGYNAMVDEAGVGGGARNGVTRVREGVDPLIIFDAEDVLEERKTRKISSHEQSRATSRNTKWYNRTNSSTYRDEPW